MNRPPQITSIEGTLIRLAEVGKIKIGGKGEERPTKAGGTFRLPVKFDHFVVTGLERTDKGKGDFIADPEVMQIIGPEAKELDVLLLHDDPDMNLQSKLSLYFKAMQWCVGNGEEGYRRNKDEHAKGIEQWDEMVCPCQEKTGEKPRCKSTFVLSVMLPQAPKIGGVYKFRSTSEISLINLKSSMEFISSITGGILGGIPLKLVLQPQTVTPKGIVTKVYVANLEFRGDILELLEAATTTGQRRAVGFQQTRKLRAQIDRLLLAPPESETDEDIADEFYPEGSEVIEGEVVDAATPAVDFPKADDQQQEEPEPKEEEQPPPPAEAPPTDDGESSDGRITDQQRKHIFALAREISDTTDKDLFKKNLKTQIYNIAIKPPDEKVKPDPDISYSITDLTVEQASLVIEKFKEYKAASEALGLDSSHDPPQAGTGPPPADQAEQAGEASSLSSGPEQASSPEPSNKEPEPPHGGDGEETAEQPTPPMGSPAPPDPVKDAILLWLADALSGKIADVAQGSANVLLRAFLSTYDYATLSSASADELEQFKGGLIKKARPVPASNPSKSTKGSKQESSPKTQEDLF